MQKYIKNILSKNFDDRKKGYVIDTIVIHHTVIDDLKKCLEKLTLKKYKVSAHYLINDNGDIYQLVNDDKRAWHAGISYWRSRRAVNDFSIGIELLNNGFSKFSKPQMKSLINLCDDIKCKFNIDPKNIIGHSDVAPNRKIDPSRFFDWETLFNAGIGIFDSNTNITDNVSLLNLNDNSDIVINLKERLKKFGYELNTNNSIYDIELNLVISAFKRHHNVRNISLMGWDKASDLILDSLLERYYG